MHDASPDTDLHKQLTTLSELGLIHYLINTKNLGFVKTVNRGMKLHPERDIVLLNSDTVVYARWLDRLAAHAEQNNVASVTPFSNNATICSYPYEHKNNRDCLEITYSELDSLCDEINHKRAIDIPTGVGFCMYITRKSIMEVGYFDYKSFRRGYGEENDFCRSAFKKGYRNLFALDVFVRHTGEVSFSGESKELQEAALKALLKKHPDYISSINQYVIENPGKSYRRLLDAARLKRATYGRSILFVVNARTGGIFRYIHDAAVLLKTEGFGVVTLSPMIVDTNLSYINTLNPLIVPNLCGLDLKLDNQELIQLLKVIGVESISINSFVDWSIESLALIQKLADQLGIGYNFIIHDYTAICPKITMTDQDGIYCGYPFEKTCRVCLSKNRTYDTSVDILEWRSRYESLFENAQAVIAPSEDTARRIEYFFPKISVEIQQHIELLDPLSAPLVVPYSSGPIRIAIIGAIGPPKGSNILLACAKDAFRNRQPLQFVIIGYSNIDGEFCKLPNVEITGAYNENEIYDLIADRKCHAAFFPSVVPETYCYALSHALNAGLPCVSFDLGAQAERLKKHKQSMILKTQYFDKPKYINEQLIDFVTNLKK
ncbi:MAG: glycosyltransferase [Pseudomonadota bacterium]